MIPVSRTSHKGGKAIDIWTKEKRSDVMSRIRSKDTGPEKCVRSLLFRMGYRYRVHMANLPGKPDIIFSKKRKVIFIHGCFWHQHPDAKCKNSGLPKSNAEYWRLKLERNQERDSMSITALETQGWQVLVVWECQVKDQVGLMHELIAFLGPPRPTSK